MARLARLTVTAGTTMINGTRYHRGAVITLPIDSPQVAILRKSGAWKVAEVNVPDPTPRELARARELEGSAPPPEAAALYRRFYRSRQDFALAVEALGPDDRRAFGELAVREGEAIGDFLERIARPMREREDRVRELEGETSPAPAPGVDDGSPVEAPSTPPAPPAPPAPAPEAPAVANTSRPAPPAAPVPMPAPKASLDVGKIDALRAIVANPGNRTIRTLVTAAGAAGLEVPDTIKHAADRPTVLSWLTETLAGLPAAPVVPPPPTDLGNA